MTDSIIHLIHRAGMMADEAFRETDINITARQAAVLMAMSKLEAPSQSDLVMATAIDRSTMADIVRRLCRAGLVKRRRTLYDARRYALRLTDKGKEVAAAAERAADAAGNLILERIDPKLRAAFVRALETLKETEEQRAEELIAAE